MRSNIASIPEQLIEFVAIQEVGLPEYPSFPIYNLTCNIPGHPAGSTISRRTLEENGYVLPNDAP